MAGSDLQAPRHGPPADDSIDPVADAAPRPLTEADLDAVMAIEAGAYAFPWSRGNVADSLKAGHRAIGWYAADGSLLGYCIAMAGVDEWHLLNLTVAPALQGRGLGRRMLADLADHARGGGAERLWLEVRESNHRARQLYERCGFAVLGLRRRYYPAGRSAREDAVVMGLAWR
jgi:ribosomal-protein-alanine N-acetyltransferase